MFGTPPLRGTRILIAGRDTILRRHLRRVLVEGLGHRVIGEAASGTDLVRLALALEPQVLVFENDLPHLSGIGALMEIQRVRRWPAIALVHDGHIEETAEFPQDLTYIAKPALIGKLQKGLEEAVSRFERRLQEEELVTTRTKLRHERVMINQAKLVLMDRHSLDEPGAHRRLQRLAMNRRLPLVKVAREVLAESFVDAEATATNTWAALETSSLAASAR